MIDRSQLKVLGTAEQVAEFGEGTPVPATRAECMGKESTCRAFRCKYSLIGTAPVDRAGRRHHDHQHRSWLVDLHRPHRCVLALADAHPEGMTAVQIAKVLGQTPRNVQRLIGLAAGKVEAETKRNAALADDMDAEARIRDASILSLEPRHPSASRMPQVVATVTVTVAVGDRVASVTANPEQARALLASMRNAPAASVRDLANELRIALGGQ